MFRLMKICSLTVVCTVLGSCATYFRLSPESQEGVSTFLLDGVRWAEAEKNGVKMAIKGEKQMPSHLSFQVFVHNGSKERFDLDTASIRAFAVGDTEVRPIRVVQADEYLQELRVSQAIVLGLQAFSAGVNAANASTRTYETHSSGRLYGNGLYSGSYVSQSTTVVDDPYARIMAQRDAERQMASTSANFNERIAYFDRVLLRSNTLFPGQEVMGTVLINSEEASKYRVEVPLGTVTHSFTFSRPDQ